MAIGNTSQAANYETCTVCQSNPATEQLHKAHTNSQTGETSAIHKACASCAYDFFKARGIKENNNRIQKESLIPCFSGCKQPIDFRLISLQTLRNVKFSELLIQDIRSQTSTEAQHNLVRQGLSHVFELDYINQEIQTITKSSQELEQTVNSLLTDPNRKKLEAATGINLVKIAQDTRDALEISLNRRLAHKNRLLANQHQCEFKTRYLTNT